MDIELEDELERMREERRYRKRGTTRCSDGMCGADDCSRCRPWILAANEEDDE